MTGSSLAQRVLRRPGDLLIQRQPGGHREDLGIEERHPQLERLAIVILSALTRMSPRSQVNRSMCCMRATGSQPSDSAYTLAVTSVWVQSVRNPGSTACSCASEKLRALP